MGAPKLEKFPVQLLGLGVIQADPEIQSRVRMSPEHVRLFSEQMLDGKEFDPIDVFFDGKVYLLSNGFHRYTAQRQASRVRKELVNIRATVRPGTRRDAIVFSAGSNKELCIPRTTEDIHKAIHMLLDDAEWFICTETEIAEYVGCSRQVVTRVRANYYTEKGIDPPTKFKDRKGRLLSPRRSKQKVEASGPAIISQKNRDNNNFFSYIDGDRVYLGSSESEAKEKVTNLRASIEQERNTLSRPHIERLLLQTGITTSFLGGGSFQFGVNEHGQGVCFRTKTHVCFIARFDRSHSVREAVGAVLLARVHSGEDLLPVVVCRPQDSSAEMLDLARQLGVEFLTPEELVESIKGKQEP